MPIIIFHRVSYVFEELKFKQVIFCIWFWEWEWKVQRSCRKTGGNTSHSRSTLARTSGQWRVHLWRKGPINILAIFLLVWSTCRESPELPVSTYPLLPFRITLSSWLVICTHRGRGLVHCCILQCSARTQFLIGGPKVHWKTGSLTERMNGNQEASTFT